MVGAVIAVSVMHVLLFVLDMSMLSMLKECESARGTEILV